MPIVAAVDRSDRASDVVQEAQSLAELTGETVHVVHVMTRSEFVDIERTSVSETGRAVDMAAVKRRARETAATAASDLEVPTEAIGRMGDPGTEVVEYARTHDARYIVVAGRKRSPTGKALLGSVSQSILLNADCPVVSTIE